MIIRKVIFMISQIERLQVGYLFYTRQDYLNEVLKRD